ncbi:MAG: transporter ATP-binding protein [Candidatus Eremiobacteraeota bacterium]|nr:transporter ATP-binding protein [Candidatus Eremiobacteraeota bacterium]
MLRTRELTKRFGAHAAVDGVNVEIRRGTLHAIIGPNGAGKTTLFNLLSGELRPSEGAVEFAGRDVTCFDATTRSQLGIGRSFQRTNVFPKLTVFENVRLAAQTRTGESFALWRSVTELADVSARAERVLDEFGLLGYRSQLASELAGGDQRLLELAITLATDPVLLLLDEPSQGLSPEDARRLIDRIGTLAERYTIVLIEHNVPLVMRLATEITVMNFGRVLAHGTPDEIRANPAVRTAYLGTRGTR